MNRRM